jgi:hypothetical protein
LKGDKGVMDEMKIGSNLMKSVISKLINKVLMKKFGYNIDIRIEEINASIIDGKAHIRLNADAEMSKDKLVKILKAAGLD